MLLATLNLEFGSYKLHDVNKKIIIIDTKTNVLEEAIQAIDKTLDNDLQVNKITESLYEIATIYGRVRKGIISI